MNTLGKRISERRKALNLTQEDVAAHMNVSAQAASKWENDLSCPDIMSLPALAELLQVSVDTLLRDRQADVQFIPAAQRKSMDDMMLRIRIHAADQTVVRINVPLTLIRVLMQSGTSPVSVMGGDAMKNVNVDFQQILQLVESGAIGKLMEIETDDGTRVEILVE